MKISKAEWITTAGTHDGIVTQEEFDKAQLAMREFMERDGINLGEWVLRHKVRCGVCGYAMTRSKAKHPLYYCRTSRISDAFACSSERVPEADILEAVLDGLHVQAMAAVEMARIWEERHRRKKTDTAALRKNIAALREAHSRLERQIKDLLPHLGWGKSAGQSTVLSKPPPSKSGTPLLNSLPNGRPSWRIPARTGSCKINSLSGSGPMWRQKLRKSHRKFYRIF